MHRQHACALAAATESARRRCHSGSSERGGCSSPGVFLQPKDQGSVEKRRVRGPAVRFSAGGCPATRAVSPRASPPALLASGVEVEAESGRDPGNAARGRRDGTGDGARPAAAVWAAPVGGHTLWADEGRLDAELALPPCDPEGHLSHDVTSLSTCPPAQTSADRLNPVGASRG